MEIKCHRSVISCFISSVISLCITCHFQLPVFVFSPRFFTHWLLVRLFPSLVFRLVFCVLLHMSLSSSLFVHCLALCAFFGGDIKGCFMSPFLPDFNSWDEVLFFAQFWVLFWYTATEKFSCMLPNNVELVKFAPCRTILPYIVLSQNLATWLAKTQAACHSVHSIEIQWSAALRLSNHAQISNPSKCACSRCTLFAKQHPALPFLSALQINYDHDVMTWDDVRWSERLLEDS